MYKGWSAFNSLLVLFTALTAWAGLCLYLDSLDNIRVLALAPTCDGGVFCVLYKWGHVIPKVYRYKKEFVSNNYAGDFPAFAINYAGAWILEIIFIILALRQISFWASAGIKINWNSFSQSQEKSLRNVQRLMLAVGLMMFFDNFVGLGIFHSPGASLSEHLGYKTYFFRPPLELSVMYLCFCFWTVLRKKKRPPAHQ